jgi:hypothetical protein
MGGTGMNVASLDNCKRLWEVSEWDGTQNVWLPDGKGGWELEADNIEQNGELAFIPAYDLGYLLRKLHIFIDWHMSRDDRGYVIHIAGDDWIADTPEDAVAELAIALFKRGIYQKVETA